MFRLYWRRSSMHAPLRRAAFRALATSTFVLHEPPASAPREAPTPLVLVSATSWDTDSSKEMRDISSMLAEKGFTCLQTDLSLSDGSQTNSAEMLKDYSNELRSVIRYSGNPFAPVIVARSTSCLISQKYISSYPATGLILISPPSSTAELVGTKLPTPLDEFIYEPKFPIAIIDTPDRIRKLKDTNRLCQDPGPFVDIIPVERLEGQPLFAAVDLWLDTLGI